MIKIFPEKKASYLENGGDLSNFHLSSQFSSKEVENTRLDWFGRFRDKSLQLEFIKFCLDQKSVYTPLLITVILLAWAIAESISSMEQNSNSVAEFVFNIICFISAGIGFILYIGLFYFSRRKNATSWQIISLMQLLYITWMAWIFISKLIRQLVVPGASECLPPDFNAFIHPPTGTDFWNSSSNPGHHPPPPPPFHSFQFDNHNSSAPFHTTSSNLTWHVGIHNFIGVRTCPSSNSLSALSSFDMLVLVSFCPLLLMAIVYEPRLHFILSCYTIVAGLLLYSVYSSFYQLLPILTVLIILLILLVELHFQRVQTFLNNRHLQNLLQEKERNADALHALEMRHMIGNVAHDLKTPLASFANGMDAIEEIISTAKHQFKTRVGEDVSAFLDWTLAIENCLQSIRNTNAFMLMTINRCIDYTKASKGIQLVPNNETISLKEVLFFPMDCMRNLQDRIAIRLESLPPELCAQVITDKQWLQENLLCLLSNAVKYSSEGEVVIRVLLSASKPQSLLTQSETRRDSARQDTNTSLGEEESTALAEAPPLSSSPSASIPAAEGYLCFEVEDTGIGIADATKRTLFTQFKQAQRLAGGTGLGLFSLAKRVEALHGSVGIRNRSDGRQGSLFWFAIPYRPDFDASRVEEATLLPPPLLAVSETLHPSTLTTVTEKQTTDHFQPLPSLKHRTTSNGEDVDTQHLLVLLVDDAPSILKMLSMMLQRLGCTVTCAENGEIALRRVEEQWRRTGKPFDLILMDLQMPVMDGLEAMRRLREMEREQRDWMTWSEEAKQRQHLIFGVSANSDHQTMEEALLAGANDFLGKPFSKDLFLKLLRNHLNQK